jgi:hypothetical protein
MPRPGGSGFPAPVVKVLENSQSSKIALRLNRYESFLRTTDRKNHGSELVNMLLTEWNSEDALEVEREEGLEEEAGNALAKGLPLDTIGEITDLDMETIKGFAGQ